MGGLAKYLFIASFFLAVVNLFPMKARKRKTDGMHIFNTLFNSKECNAIRFHVRCQESASILQQLNNQGDWTGLKELAEELLAISANVRAKEEVVQMLKTVVRFANGRIAEECESQLTENLHQSIQ